MITVKQGGHRLFERDQQAAQVVSGMLSDLERRGMDAVREYSRRLDGWDPPSFELGAAEISGATSRATRYTGGLWVGKFLKTCTYQRMTREASREVGGVTERQCIRENMLAHGITARARVDRYGAPRGLPS